MAPVVPDPRKIAFRQRYTPRGKKSMWSQINRDHIARLTRAGLMQPPGRTQVDAAKADGRRAAAYAPIRSASKDTVPAGCAKRIADLVAMLARGETIVPERL